MRRPPCAARSVGRACRRSPRAGARSPRPLRAIGPTVSNVHAIGTTPSVGTRPIVGRSPVTPQKQAGIRIEPPVSVPSVPAARSAAAAAPLPPLEPPQIRARGPRVPRGPEVRARRHRAVGELVRVQLAEHDRARLAQARDRTVASRAGDVVARGSPSRRSSRVPATSITSLTATGSAVERPARRRARPRRAPPRRGRRCTRSGRAVASIRSRYDCNRLARRELRARSRRRALRAPCGVTALSSSSSLEPRELGQDRVEERAATASTSSSEASTPCRAASCLDSPGETRPSTCRSTSIAASVRQRFEEFVSTSDEPVPAVPELRHDEPEAPATRGSRPSGSRATSTGTRCRAARLGSAPTSVTGLDSEIDRRSAKTGGRRAA